jgi:hypothetical protein
VGHVATDIKALLASDSSHALLGCHTVTGAARTFADELADWWLGSFSSVAVNCEACPRAKDNVINFSLHFFKHKITLVSVPSNFPARLANSLPTLPNSSHSGPVFRNQFCNCANNTVEAVRLGRDYGPRCNSADEGRLRLFLLQ